MLDGQYELAKTNLEGLQETLGTIRSRVETLKKEKPGFACTITFIGTPVDKGMRSMLVPEECCRARASRSSNLLLAN